LNRSAVEAKLDDLKLDDLKPRELFDGAVLAGALLVVGCATGTDDDSFPPGGGPNTAPGFVSLAPALGAPLDPQGGSPVTPPAPAGWNWYPIDGAICRDGSPAGIFARFTGSNKLYVYVEGGGACTNLGFCNYNPSSVDEAISGDGQSVIGSALGVVPARQVPGVFTAGVLQGVFDTQNPANPVKDHNGVYIPYCTGDVHFGTRRDVTVPGVNTPQQFVGYLNMQKFVARIVPTFKDDVDHVLLLGVSAGSFGAALNFSMFQDAFGAVRVDALLDSGPPFSDQYMPVCMQKRWRETWGLNDAFPPDCTECRNPDGGGMINFANFLIRKHPNARLAMISSMEDEVIRLFFSMGVKDCANADTIDPVALTITQILDPTIFFAATTYTDGLNDLRARFSSTGRFGTYFMSGAAKTYHQHVFRQRFYETPAGSQTIAEYVTLFLNGQIAQVGP
jgi:hypothetical protein